MVVNSFCDDFYPDGINFKDTIGKSRQHFA